MSENGKSCVFCHNKLAAKTRALRESVAVVPYGQEPANLPIAFTSRDIMANISPEALMAAPVVARSETSFHRPSANLESVPAAERKPVPARVPVDSRRHESISQVATASTMPAPLREMLTPRPSQHYDYGPNGPELAVFQEDRNTLDQPVNMTRPNARVSSSETLPHGSAMHFMPGGFYDLQTGERQEKEGEEVPPAKLTKDDLEKIGIEGHFRNLVEAFVTLKKELEIAEAEEQTAEEEIRLLEIAYGLPKDYKAADLAKLTKDEQDKVSKAANKRRAAASMVRRLEDALKVAESRARDARFRGRDHCEKNKKPEEESEGEEGF